MAQKNVSGQNTKINTTADDPDENLLCDVFDELERETLAEAEEDASIRPVTGDDHYENFSHVLLAGLETLNERISQASRLTAGMADLVRTKLADGQALKNADKLFLTGLLFCLEKRGVVFEELTKTGQLQEVPHERFEK